MAIPSPTKANASNIDSARLHTRPNHVLVSETVATRDDGRLVLFILYQMTIVAVTTALCALWLPILAVPVALGAAAVVLPNALVALLIRQASRRAVVVYAMARSLVVGSTVFVGFVVLEPNVLPYLSGAGVGFALVALVPVIVELLAPTSVQRPVKA